jgi:hypothetical protein
MFWIVSVVMILVGILSVLWISRGMKEISDPLIKKLFKYIMALITALIAVSLVFMVWVSLSPEVNVPEETTKEPTIYVFLVSISALIVGSSIAVKRIGDEYGFKVDDK